MFIRIADVDVEINIRDIRLLTFYRTSKYSIRKSNSCVIRVLNKDISVGTDENHIGKQKIMKRLAVIQAIANRLPYNNAFLLHSACFDVDGVGVAFAAHSGTGKTTHMLLWQKLLGDRLKIVNGDKPIIRFFDDDPASPYAYGTPWCGKERLGCNMRTPLRHICFIERAEENSCTPINAADAVNRIFNQVYMPADPKAAACTLELVNRLLSSCKLWLIRCNMDISAAETSYNAIFGRSDN